MLTPTKLGVFGENSLVFTTPDESNAFATLLRRLNCSNDSDHIYVPRTDWASPASVSLFIQRRLRPDDPDLPADAPASLVIFDLALGDPKTTAPVPDVAELVDDGHCEADFDRTLRTAQALFPDTMRVHHHGRISTTADRASLAAHIPIDLDQPDPLGTMIGARFSLGHPEIDHGNAILDTHNGSLAVSLTLSFQQSLRLSPESITRTWGVIREIYDTLVITKQDVEPSDGE